MGGDLSAPKLQDRSSLLRIKYLDSRQAGTPAALFCGVQAAWGRWKQHFL